MVRRQGEEVLRIGPIYRLMIKDILGAILGTIAFIAIWILAACL
jgi:hypothetical protein